MPETTDPTPPSEPTAEQTEEAFWAKFDERVDGILDKWLARTIEKHRTTSSSRMGGRTSLPNIIMDAFMGNLGTPKKD